MIATNLQINHVLTFRSQVKCLRGLNSPQVSRAGGNDATPAANQGGCQILTLDRVIRPCFAKISGRHILTRADHHSNLQ